MSLATADLQKFQGTQMVNEAMEVASSYVPATLFGGDDPSYIAEQAAAKAKVLKDVVNANGLAKKLGRGEREHIQLEGWTFLGSMFGVFGVIRWTKQLVDEGGNRYGWEARAEAVTLDGRIVGAAEAMCSKDEGNWRTRDEYALRSMAQTRAVSKALRMPLSFVVVLAGYEATPSDEIPESPGESTATATRSAEPSPADRRQAGTIAAADAVPASPVSSESRSSNQPSGKATVAEDRDSESSGKGGDAGHAGSDGSEANLGEGVTESSGSASHEQLLDEALKLVGNKEARLRGYVNTFCKTKYTTQNFDEVTSTQLRTTIEKLRQLLETGKTE